MIGIPRGAEKHSFEQAVRAGSNRYRRRSVSQRKAAKRTGLVGRPRWSRMVIAAVRQAPVDRCLTCTWLTWFSIPQ
jgi:hypothetical protein